MTRLLGEAEWPTSALGEPAGWGAPPTKASMRCWKRLLPITVQRWVVMALGIRPNAVDIAVDLALLAARYKAASRTPQRLEALDCAHALDDLN